MNSLIMFLATETGSVANKIEQTTSISQKLMQSRVWQFYMSHFTLINALLIILIVFIIMRMFFSSINKDLLNADNEKVAGQIANWLAPQCNYTVDELKPEILLLLQGKRSDLLSDIILGLKDEFTEKAPSEYSRQLKVYCLKDGKVLETTFSSTLSYENVPPLIRHEFNLKDCKTLVYDYLKQAFVMDKDNANGDE